MNDHKLDTPIIFVDMTVGNESARIAKVRHQGFTETVRVLNGVLKKMNAEVKLEIENLNAPPTFEIPDFPDIAEMPDITESTKQREQVSANDS